MSLETQGLPLGFAIFGLVAAIYIGCRICYGLWTGIKIYLLGPLLGLGADLKGMGEWAVVTGATDGLGKSYAMELARKGINIVLISRTLQKLTNTAHEIESKYHVRTKCVAVDFSHGQEIYDEIRGELQGMDIGILVNNVGQAPSAITRFSNRTDIQNMRNIVIVNAISLVMMTNMILPRMVAKGRGAVLNIGSGMGTHPIPGVVVYAGTKAFVDAFTRNVQLECLSTGVIVQCVRPFMVATKMSYLKRSVTAPDSDTYVKSQLATVGLTDKTVGYWIHALVELAFNLLPTPVYQRTMISIGDDYSRAMEAANASTIHDDKKSL